LSNSVRDAARVMNVIAGPDDRDRTSLSAGAVDYEAGCVPEVVDQTLRGLRLAFSTDLGFGYPPPDEIVRTTVAAAARRLVELGCEVEDVEPGWSGPVETWNTIFYGGIVGQLADNLEQTRSELDQGLVGILDHYQDWSLAAYVQAESARGAFWDQVRTFFTRYDLLLTPTVPGPAFELMRNTPERVPGSLAEGLGWSYYTYPFNLTGQPAASLPCGFSPDGLPIGLQIVGPRHADALVLTASVGYELLAPWQAHRAPLTNS
jgi:aspartyl-tRNA(Asn)/glutamyl-tRNA(Gln) amidotransferase subunit A